MLRVCFTRFDSTDKKLTGGVLEAGGFFFFFYWRGHLAIALSIFLGFDVPRLLSRKKLIRQTLRREAARYFYLCY